MKRLILLSFVYLLLGAASGPVPINIPVTIPSGLFYSATFNVPKVVDKHITAQIPCEAAWSIKIGLQFSTDKGATWDCDFEKGKCGGFNKGTTAPNSCGGTKGFLVAPFQVVGTHPAHQAGTSMRVAFLSNQAKTFTATLTFD